MDGKQPLDESTATPPAVEFDLAGLISEKEVPARYPGIFAANELPVLRRRKKISCFRLSAKRIFYREEDLRAYIAGFYRPAKTVDGAGGGDDHEGG